jgi:hypothetical protein
MLDRNEKLYFVFDVESVGLHGDGFSYGYVVINRDGEELESGGAHCSPNDAQGKVSDRKWVKEHCDVASLGEEVLYPGEVRRLFWERYLYWKSRRAVTVCDCPWPVEARFLIACIADSEGRDWDGPYPLIDVASVRLAVGLDPLGTEERLPNELPAHNPLADARQSARLLLEALQKGN